MTTMTPARHRALPADPRPRAAQQAARHRAEVPVARPARARTLLLRVLPGAVLTVLLLALALLVVVPRVLGWVPLTVLSGSMEPTIPTGSQVVVSRADVDALEVGDVITVMPYPNDPTLVTHRIVERTESVDGPTFRTQGDANDAADPWDVTEQQIRGEVRYWVPGAGYVATLLSGHTKALGTMVVAVSLLGYAGLQLVTAARGRRDEAA